MVSSINNIFFQSNDIYLGESFLYSKLNFILGVATRLRQLEALFVGGPVQGGRMGHTFSIETLIDILLVLYDECCNSSLRREKTVSDFIEFGKTYLPQLFIYLLLFFLHSQIYKF